MDIITMLQGIPVAGPVLPYLPLAIAIAAALATVLPVPAADSGAGYRLLYAVLQWCALNKGRAANAAKAPSAPKPPLSALLALVLAGAMLQACAAAPQTARQGVYAAIAAYDVALRGAVTYAELPRCTAPAAPAICSDAAIVTAMDAAAQKARPVVLAALDTAADTKASDPAIAQAAAAVKAAAGALAALIPTTGG